MAGYSGTPLAKKLGIKNGFKVLIVNQPDHYFDLFDNFPEVEEGDEHEVLDFIHFFTTGKDELEEQLRFLKERMKKDGMLWVSWPKKASRIPTTVDENLVRSMALQNGLVDVKVCAVDDVWSGLKLVYRVKDR
ncbi:hypothetical protein C900_04030 [Fulvivirga imtechensis AK7]|uniref:DUF3052 domain-containing protein n=1 Tax=Fulvivirga imtechensis AK7 TaxID=1237149 RepID=L8JNE6_9BACT|nr:DUF3052 family protein [Fulvivirga imtechensis]ELR70345.1 hypothetical protein C900_04030 [Fulvivirga imtechensis AK7]